MKKFLLLSATIITLFAFTSLSSWKADNAHSKISFSVTHLGISDVTGLFKDFTVDIKSAKDNFSDAKIEMSVDVKSIDTEVEMRDNHLRSADFFDVAKHPKMTFSSTSVTPTKVKNKYLLKGNLTLAGITKPVTMDLWYRGTIENPMNKKPTAGFKVSGTIKRSDFNLGAGFPPPMISDEVKIVADGEFIKE